MSYVVPYIYMGLRKESFALGEYYHLYNRGVEKRTLFEDEQDHRYFLFLMYVCNTVKSLTLRRVGEYFERGETIVDIGAYCLMPNHFHILVREKSENGITTYMRKLLTAYSMYFNKKYKRTGRLYENTFKSSYVKDDQYLKYLYSYIHLNPAKLVDENWKEKKDKDNLSLLNSILFYPYSSVQEYKYLKYKIVNPQPFPQYFVHFNEHTKELFQWLSAE